MKKYTITIDCGTTNTRVLLFDDAQRPLYIEKKEIGVRNTAIDGNNKQLKKAISSCIHGLLEKENLSFDNVKSIVATGMITSNMGIVEIPHLIAPVSIKQLATSMQTVLVEDICPLPISFVPGIKNMDGQINIGNMENMDMMRGEEVESCALIEQLHCGKPMLLILPGSHTKFVAVDKHGHITGCLSSIAGELLAAITQHTLIADAVNSSFVDSVTYDRDTLLAGYLQASKNGLGRACFSTRIFSQFVSSDKTKAANFLLGSVLQGDIAAIKNSSTLSTTDDTVVVVAGKSPLRDALLDILRFENSFQNIIEYIPIDELPLSAAGVFVLLSKV
mgnify:CR=1 FL=1